MGMISDIGTIIVGIVLTTSLSYGDNMQQPTAGEYGPTPRLPPPEKSLIPTLNIAKACLVGKLA